MTIPPPIWASLPTDPNIPRPPLVKFFPETIEITELASCSCANPRNKYSPIYPTSTRPCVIYGFSHACSSHIELQACLLCRRRWIGPECSDLGLFNFNNRVLLTCELLDDYTSAYTTSETPFAAWVTVTTRRYESQQSEFKFMTEQMFRAVWFAYIKLLYLEGDMQCPHCGPSPETTIWDGVTLAFNRKHLLPSLQPPTVICDDSLNRGRCRYLYKQQLLPDKKLRTLVRGIITGRSLLLADTSRNEVGDRRDDQEGDGGNSEDGEEKGMGRSSAAKVKKELLARIEAIPGACNSLSDVDAGLGDLFTQHFGLIALAQKRWGPPVYRQFFVQVCVDKK